MKHIMLRAIKNAEIVYSVEKISPFVTLTNMVLTSLDTYVAANKQCIRLLQSYFPIFSTSPMKEVVVDRLLQT